MLVKSGVYTRGRRIICCKSRVVLDGLILTFILHYFAYPLQVA